MTRRLWIILIHSFFIGLIIGELVMATIILNA